MSSQNNGQDELNKGWVEIGAAGTLGISVGSKIVKAIDNSGGKANNINMNKENRAKA
jgi:hypothetical protein